MEQRLARCGAVRSPYDSIGKLAGEQTGACSIEDVSWHR